MSAPNTTLRQELFNVHETVPTDGETESNTTDGYNSLLLAVSVVLWRYVSPVVMLTGLTGNCLSLAVMLGRRFRRQTVTVYFGALALTDSYNLMNSLPRFWYPTVADSDPVSRSDAGCRFSTFSLYFSYQLSCWVLVAVTVERALAVAFPLKTKHLFTRTRAVIVLATVAALLFGYNAYILFYKEGYLEELEDGTVVCSLNVFYTDTPFFSSHLWIDLMLCSLIPFAVIIFSNVIIVKKVIESKRFKGNSGDKGRKIATPSIKMLLCISTMFIFFTLPLSIMLLYMQTYQILDVDNDGLPSVLWACAVINLYCNNSLNFFFYSLTGRTFRKQLRDYMGKLKICFNVPKPMVHNPSSMSSYSLNTIENADCVRAESITLSANI